MLQEHNTGEYHLYCLFDFRDLRSHLDREISERTLEGENLRHLIEENAKVNII